MTNRKWINSLSNEQLVKLMRAFREHACDMCTECDNDEGCGYCFENQVKWLQQEHEEERWLEHDFEYSFW